MSNIKAGFARFIANDNTRQSSWGVYGTEQQPVDSSVKSARGALCGLIFIALFVGTPAFAASVGMVTKVENQAQVGGAAAAVGTLVQMGDQLHTGPKSRLEVTFQDKTTITLGENATLGVDRYIYNPERSTGELLVSSGVGAFRMATGRLNEMSNKKINASTPFGALAVRGTEFWWGQINHQYGTLLMTNSRLVVSHETDRCPPEEERKGHCRCAVTLTQSGQGTDILRSPECPQGENTNDRRCWRCPGLPYFWSPAQVSAALSQTQFGLASLGGTTTGTVIVGGAVAGTAAAAAASAAANHENHEKKKKLPPQPEAEPASP